MTTEEFHDEEQPSKSHRKREAIALQKLGQQLIDLPASRLQELPVIEQVITAIDAYKRLPNSHGARKRQLQYIGRLMRECDFEAITQALTTEPPEQPAPAISSETELSCDKILLDGDRAINQLLSRNPNLDRQKLRQFYRLHSKASEPQREAVKRKLLQYLQQVDSSQGD
jgi:ribosome-associated protein